MAATVRCPNPDCRKAFSVEAENRGKQVRCKKCGTRFKLSENGEPSPAKETFAGSNSRQPVSTAPAADDKVNRLGRFTIQKRLGSGAFGAVYQAHDPQLEREVALKVPHAERVSDPRHGSRFIKRFLNEAKAAARLQHPHIVPVFDAGKDGNRYYIASAFIEGQSLDAALGDQLFDFRRTARIVMQLAEALAYAHAQGIVHRDVKPANVMLDWNGEPHLMDFGLARLQTSDEKLTRDGGVLGTPGYMSPEQARGDLDEVGRASDQYSLGVLLYEMLCGQTPFAGPPEVVIYNVLNEEPVAPRTTNDEVPHDLETICLKAIAKENTSRFADCEQLAADLRRWLDDQPIRSRRTGTIERILRWCKRNPRVTGLSAGIAAVIVAATVLAIENRSVKESASQSKQLASRKELESQQSMLAKRAAVQETRRAQSESRAARREAEKAYAQQVALAFRIGKEKDLDGMNTILAKCPERLRHWEWFFLWHQGHVDPASLMIGPNGPDITMVVNPFTRRVVDAGFTKYVKLNAPVRQVSFSRNGQRLAAAELSGNVTVYNALTGQQLHELKLNSDEALYRIARPGRVALDPDGSQVACVLDDGTLGVFDAATGQLESAIHCYEMDYKYADSYGYAPRTLEFSPDGERFLIVDSVGRAGLLDIASGKKVATLNPDPHLLGITHLATYSPDGTKVITDWHGRVTVREMDKNPMGLIVWDAQTGEKLNTINIREQIMCMALNSDGRRVVACVSLDGGGGNIVWDVATGRKLPSGHSPDAKAEDLRSSNSRMSTRLMAYSPDAARIITIDVFHRLRMWEAESGLELMAANNLHEPLACRFSRDGRRITIVSESGITILDAGPDWKPPDRVIPR